jgi:hypothetical protein
MENGIPRKMTVEEIREKESLQQEKFGQVSIA